MTNRSDRNHTVSWIIVYSSLQDHISKVSNVCMSACAWPGWAFSGPFYLYVTYKSWNWTFVRHLSWVCIQLSRKTEGVVPLCVSCPCHRQWTYSRPRKSSVHDRRMTSSRFPGYQWRLWWREFVRWTVATVYQTIQRSWADYRPSYWQFKTNTVLHRD